MLIFLWLVLCLAVVSFIVLLPALWRRDILNRYSGSRCVTCPEDQHPAVVSIDARRAAAAEMDGRADFRLRECTRWPERAGCKQPCLPQAVREEPYPSVEVNKRSKQIYHLPIALAAFAAWCLGALWHSQYVFRPEWADAAGLTHAQVKQMVWWVSPHLLSAAACLLFAYGVAWLLLIWHRKGVLQGILMAVLLCLAVTTAGWFGIARMPHSLLVIEAGYAVLATCTMGAIVGGLYNKLVLPSQ